MCSWAANPYFSDRLHRSIATRFADQMPVEFEEGDGRHILDGDHLPRHGPSHNLDTSVSPHLSSLTGVVSTLGSIRCKGGTWEHSRKQCTSQPAFVLAAVSCSTAAAGTPNSRAFADRKFPLESEQTELAPPICSKINVEACLRSRGTGTIELKTKGPAIYPPSPSTD